MSRLTQCWDQSPRVYYVSWHLDLIVVNLDWPWMVLVLLIIAEDSHMDGLGVVVQSNMDWIRPAAEGSHMDGLGVVE